MRSHGTLVKWNDERGFGFITLASAAEEVFVHASAFPHDGRRPEIGEMISFEVQAGADGRRRAVRVQRPRGSSPGHARPRQSPSAVGGMFRAAAVIAMLVAIGAAGYARWWDTSPVAREPVLPLAVATPAQPLLADPPYACDGRTHCSQMRSCAEAEFFLANCPGTQMDGNNDGEPCEQQHCN